MALETGQNFENGKLEITDKVVDQRHPGTQELDDAVDKIASSIATFIVDNAQTTQSLIDQILIAFDKQIEKIQENFDKKK